LSQDFTGGLAQPSVRNHSNRALVAQTPAKALLVTLGFGRDKKTAESLNELASLAATAGWDPAIRSVSHRPAPDPALFLGSGKANELFQIIESESIDSVLIDHAVSPAQQRNLERLWKVPVYDRSELILAIFAQRARSHVGKLQVELARLNHLGSRVVRGWSHLERQQGGFGLRGGPGEKQVELDRRMIGERVKQVKSRLATVEKQRRTQRKNRDRHEVFTVALVGYTNAGKSTLFNALAGEQTYAADQLFATLDTLTRRIRIEDGPEIALSDTVGFIRDLPHQLVAAFRATLDETASADLLLHVVDAASPDREEQMFEVDKVLADIGAQDVATIIVWNKIDACGFAPRMDRNGYGRIERVMVSAQTGAGVESLRYLLSALAKEHRQPHIEIIDSDEIPVETN
jgi:GTPase